MAEHLIKEDKSIQSIKIGDKGLRELAKDCVCLANAHGEEIQPSLKAIATTSDGKIYIRVGEECLPKRSKDVRRAVYSLYKKGSLHKNRLLSGKKKMIGKEN